MPKNLPGGRALRSGPDWTTNQDESFSSRQRSLPYNQRGVVSPHASEFIVTEPLNANAYLTTEVYVMPLFDPRQEVTLSEARLRVNTLAANSVMDAALYHQDTNKPDRIVKIASSEVQFDCTAAALVSRKLTAPSVVVTGALLFMACVFRAAVATVASVGTLNPQAISIRKKTIVAGRALDNSMLLSETAEDSSQMAFPLVVYLSNEYAEYL